MISPLLPAVKLRPSGGGLLEPTPTGVSMAPARPARSDHAWVPAPAPVTPDCPWMNDDGGGAAPPAGFRERVGSRTSLPT